MKMCTNTIRLKMCDIAGAQYPDDGSVRPMLGESISRFLAGETEIVHDENHVTMLYHGGRAYLRQGNWKISNLEPPFDEADFELFDLAGVNPHFLNGVRVKVRRESDNNFAVFSLKCAGHRHFPFCGALGQVCGRVKHGRLSDQLPVSHRWAVLRRTVAFVL